MNLYRVVFSAILLSLLSAIPVSAALYDQNSNHYFCNSDPDGCWVTGEEGEQIYIMFWSEASRSKIMGEGSNAPLGIGDPGSDELNLKPPADTPEQLPTSSDEPTSQPSEATETPEPTSETPEATSETPEPTSETPEPTSETPEPTSETPVPTTETPEATSETPVPTTETPLPPTETPVRPSKTPVRPSKTPVFPTPTKDYSAERNACLNTLQCECEYTWWSGGRVCLSHGQWDDVNNRCYCAIP